MASYPDGNPGVWPVDSTTPVGQFRIMYGDTEAAEYDPPVPNIRDFTELSDDEIEGYLARGDASVTRGVGFYYLTLSGQAAKQSKIVKDYDLQVNLSMRAEQLLKVAQAWFDRADGEEEAGGSLDIFEVFDTQAWGPCRPELAQWGVGDRQNCGVRCSC